MLARSNVLRMDIALDYIHPILRACRPTGKVVRLRRTCVDTRRIVTSHVHEYTMMFAATDGIGEPSRLESGFPRGIPSSNLGRGVDVNKKFQTFISDWNNWFTRACSLVRLKQRAHNALILGSNPSRPIGPLAYNLLCGAGSTEIDTTGERNGRVPTVLRAPTKHESGPCADLVSRISSVQIRRLA